MFPSRNCSSLVFHLTSVYFVLFQTVRVPHENRTCQLFWAALKFIAIFIALNYSKSYAYDFKITRLPGIRISVRHKLDKYAPQERQKRKRRFAATGTEDVVRSLLFLYDTLVLVHPYILVRSLFLLHFPSPTFHFQLRPWFVV